MATDSYLAVLVCVRLGSLPIEELSEGLDLRKFFFRAFRYSHFFFGHRVELEYWFCASMAEIAET